MSEPKPLNKQEYYLNSMNKLEEICHKDFGQNPSDIAKFLDKQLQTIEKGAENTSDVDNKPSGLSNS